MDDKLLKSLKLGDKADLTSIYNQYWKILYSSAFNLLNDKETCEEIIQDIFIELWKNREKVNIRISLKSYLFACVRYKVFSEFRKNKNLRVDLFEDINWRFKHETPETAVIHQELQQHISIVVDKLPTKCQKVYKLSRHEQLSHKEIAEKLGISIKTVENHITIALKVLRSSLKTAYFILFFCFILLFIQ